MADATDELTAAKALIESRDSQYGRAYKKGGKIMAQYFPNGITLKGEEQFERFIAFLQCTSKMNRYSESLAEGGHRDSAEDLISYAAMLAEFTPN